MNGAMGQRGVGREGCRESRENVLFPGTPLVKYSKEIFGSEASHGRPRDIRHSVCGLFYIWLAGEPGELARGPSILLLSRSAMLPWAMVIGVRFATTAASGYGPLRPLGEQRLGKESGLG